MFAKAAILCFVFVTFVNAAPIVERATYQGTDADLSFELGSKRDSIVIGTVKPDFLHETIPVFPHNPKRDSRLELDAGFAPLHPHLQPTSGTRSRREIDDLSKRSLISGLIHDITSVVHQNLPSNNNKREIEDLFSGLINDITSVVHEHLPSDNNKREIDGLSKRSLISGLIHDITSVVHQNLPSNNNKRDSRPELDAGVARPLHRPRPLSDVSNPRSRREIDDLSKRFSVSGLINDITSVVHEHLPSDNKREIDGLSKRFSVSGLIHDITSVVHQNLPSDNNKRDSSFVVDPNTIIDSLNALGSGVDAGVPVTARDVDISQDTLQTLQNFVNNSTNLLNSLGKSDAVATFVSKINGLKVQYQNGSLDAGGLLNTANNLLSSILSQVPPLVQ